MLLHQNIDQLAFRISRLSETTPPTPPGAALTSPSDDLASTVAPAAPGPTGTGGITSDVIRDAILKNKAKIRSQLPIGPAQALFDVLAKIHEVGFVAQQESQAFGKAPTYGINQVVSKPQSEKGAKYLQYLKALIDLDQSISDPELQKLFTSIKAPMASYRKETSLGTNEVYNSVVNAYVANRFKPKSGYGSPEEVNSAKEIVKKVIDDNPGILQSPNAFQELLRKSIKIDPPQKAASLTAFFIKIAAEGDVWNSVLRQIYDVVVKTIKSEATPSTTETTPSNTKEPLSKTNPALFDNAWNKGRDTAWNEISPKYKDFGFENEEKKIHTDYITFMEGTLQAIKGIRSSGMVDEKSVLEFANYAGQAWLIKLPNYENNPQEKQKVYKLVTEFHAMQENAINQLNNIWVNWSSIRGLKNLAAAIGANSGAAREIYHEILSGVQPPIVSFLESLATGYPDVVGYLNEMKSNFANYNHVNQIFQKFCSDQQQKQPKTWYGKLIKTDFSKNTVVNGGTLSRAENILKEIERYAYQHYGEKDLIKKEAISFILNAIQSWHDARTNSNVQHPTRMESPTPSPALGGPPATQEDPSSPASKPNIKTVVPTSTTSEPSLGNEKTEQSIPASQRKPQDFDWSSVGLASSIFYVLWSKATGE